MTAASAGSHRTHEIVVPRQAPPGWRAGTTVTLTQDGGHRVDIEIVTVPASWSTRDLVGAVPEAPAQIVDAAAERKDPGVWRGLVNDFLVTAFPSEDGATRTWVGYQASQGIGVHVRATAPASVEDATRRVEELLEAVVDSLPRTGFLFVNQGAGWAEAGFRVGPDAVRAPASYLNDALGNPVRATAEVMLDAAPRSFSWYDEPGELTVTLRRLHADPEWVSPAVGVDRESRRPTWTDQHTTRTSLGWAVAHGAQLQLDVHGPEKYHELWIHDGFPVQALRVLHQLLPPWSIELLPVPTGWQVEQHVFVAPEADDPFAADTAAVPPATADPDAARLRSLLALQHHRRLGLGAERLDNGNWHVSVAETDQEVTDLAAPAQALVAAAAGLMDSPLGQRVVAFPVPHSDRAWLWQLRGTATGLLVEVGPADAHGRLEHAEASVLSHPVAFGLAVDAWLHDLLEARPWAPFGPPEAHPFPVQGVSLLQGRLRARGTAEPASQRHDVAELTRIATALDVDGDVVPPLLRPDLCAIARTGAGDRAAAYVRLGSLLAEAKQGDHAVWAFEQALVVPDAGATTHEAAVALAPHLQDGERADRLLDEAVRAGDAATALAAARLVVGRLLSRGETDDHHPARALLAAHAPDELVRIELEAAEACEAAHRSETLLTRLAVAAATSDPPRRDHLERAVQCLVETRGTGTDGPDRGAADALRGLRMGLLRLRREDVAGARQAFTTAAAGSDPHVAQIARALLRAEGPVPS